MKSKAGKAQAKKAPVAIEQAQAGGSEVKVKLKRKEYDAALAGLHIELVKLQQWVIHQGLKVCVVFEGRDGAGKGGTIKAITERVSPRVFRRRAPRADRPREESDLRAALHGALPGRGRGCDLRSQLV